MKYEYEPSLLKTWLKENRGIGFTKSLENANVKYKGELEKLKENFLLVQHFPTNLFIKWAEDLSRRQKLLLPNIYSPSLKPGVKENLLAVMKTTCEDEKRLFRVLVDSVYQTCDLEDLWTLLKYSYSSHQDKLSRRLTDNQALNWNEFLQSKEPVKHLAIQAYESEKGFLHELESFYLTENFPLYKLVLMEIFAFAKEEFFIKEKEMYNRYFKEATNQEQQKMAEGLIRNCKLNNVKDLGKHIYDRLKTYRRRPMLWNQVGEEEKKRFANWILKLELKDFFGNINTNHERYKYWKKYIVNLEDVVVTDNRSTLILYFPDVVIMEVLGTGAVYVYKSRDFNRHYQNKIDVMLAEKEKFQNSYYVPKEVKRSELMNKDRTVKGGWLIHVGDWQWKFDNWLRTNLSWEVRESVLLQKEAERDEGRVSS